jgi:hypothetical protein
MEHKNKSPAAIVLWLHSINVIDARTVRMHAAVTPIEAFALLEVPQLDPHVDGAGFACAVDLALPKSTAKTHPTAQPR